VRSVARYFKSSVSLWTAYIFINPMGLQMYKKMCDSNSTVKENWPDNYSLRNGTPYTKPNGIARGHLEAQKFCVLRSNVSRYETMLHLQNI